MSNKINRRDLLKGIATVPILGAFAYYEYKKIQNDLKNKSNILSELGFVNNDIKYPEAMVGTGKTLRVGIVGLGGRGQYIARAIGFAHPDYIDELEKANKENPNDNRLENFRKTPSLNIVVTGVCDLYEPRLEQASVIGANVNKQGTKEFKAQPVKKYKTYQELVTSPDVDVVIVATPDCWHAPVTIAAASAGKHVYCEKCLTHKLEDVYLVRDAIKRSGVQFQLGHQNRQAENYIKANDLIRKEALGKISLVQVCTNRSHKDGAWQYDIPKEANEQNIDWNQFVNGENIPFSLEHFFRWRCWWRYGTGIVGDLLTHEYDCVNQVLELGIPASVMASGGIYYWKDGRNVPDVLQAVMEYPHKNMTVLYSASLASELERKKLVMGSDASMEIGDGVKLMIDPNTKKYAKQLESGKVKANEPILTFKSGIKNIDAISSATEQYFASRGLLYTTRNGIMYDTTYLHFAEFLNAIRNGGETSCNIDRAFEEAVTAMLVTTSYQQNKQVRWDFDKEKAIF